MACEKTASGIICGVTPRPSAKCPCGNKATHECDRKTGVIEHPSHYMPHPVWAQAVRNIPSLMIERTCDAQMCDDCRTEIEPGIDLCRSCMAEHNQRRLW